MDPNAAQAVRRILGRYVLHGEIAAGGMAAVHLGRLLGPVGFARTVAIKRLHAQFAKDPEFVAMFLDEARLAARIRHPNVVPTLDVVQDDDEIFLVMEYVQGESLARLIKASNARDEPIAPEIACAVVNQTLLGLHAAHEATSERGTALEIVHRDVSPHNVLVGVDGIARVLDFGIAKATSRLQTTQDGQLKGKLAYMAPEQLERADVDRRADVYAASIVLWETLTGRRVFVESSPAHLMKQVLDGKIMPVAELAPWVPASIQAIVARGLARDPDARFQTAKDMAHALEETGCIASARTVGAFVIRAAHDALAEKTERLAEIEAVSAVIDAPRAVARTAPREPGTQSSAATTVMGTARSADPEAGSLLITNVTSAWRDPRRARRTMAIGAALLLGVAVFGAWAVTRDRPEPRTAGAPMTPLSAPPPATAVSAAPPGATAAPGGAGTLGVAASAGPKAPSTTIDAAPKTTASLATATAAPPKKKPPPPQKKGPDCSPPYTLDGQGIKIPKVQCL